MVRTNPRKTTTKPDVDKEEPKAKQSEVQGAGEATTKGASGGDDTTVNDADNAGGGDGVTGRTNDGATMASRDGATGTPNAKSAEISTKEGDAPQGAEHDVGFGDTGKAPTSQGEATAAAGVLPAGSLAGRGAVRDVGRRLTEVVQRFVTKGDDDERDPREVHVGPTSNLHDDLGIQRAEILDLAAELESEFDIDITPSEAQNLLLARDITNLVLRKMEAKIAEDERRADAEEARSRAKDQGNALERGAARRNQRGGTRSRRAGTRATEDAE